MPGVKSQIEDGSSIVGGFGVVKITQQEVLGRTNRLFSFHYILNIWHDTDHTENTAPNSSSIVACVIVGEGTLPSNGRGRDTDSKVIS
jgi:hypothetical protein